MVRSIFLAGPTPRDHNTPSWRPEALQLLQELKFDGHVFIPEPSDGQWDENDYSDQVEWEEAALNQADCILFWVPRDMATMPGLTTNDEWGVWKDSGKVVFGCPEDAEKVKYQLHYAKKYRVPTANTLRDTIKAAMKQVASGRLRVNGEVSVPLYVWKQPSFQSWLSYQNNAGNVLKGARVLWTFRVGPQLDKMFCWVLQVSVYIATEDRVKTNEFVLGRPDISSVVLWHRAETLADTKVVLIKEFRSPARTQDGFLREMPGGSAPLSEHITDFKHTAVSELKEETGFKLERSRLHAHPVRQVFGTLSSVGAWVYSAEISDEELEFFLAERGKVHGNIEETEQTYIEVYTVEELLKRPVTDWATLGMIFSSLYGAMR